MTDSVIPNTKVEDIAEPSPAVVAQRKRVELAAGAVFAIGEMAVRGKEALKVAELMRYLDDEYAAECKVLDSLIASEMLGQAVSVDGTKISMVKNSETH